MSERSKLYANDKVWARFYRDGKNLGEIAAEFKCSIYSISPWLASPLANAAFEGAQDLANVRAAKDAEIKAKDTQIRALEELHRDLKTIQRRIVGDTGLSAIETIDDLLKKFDAKHLAELTMEPSL